MQIKCRAWDTEYKRWIDHFRITPDGDVLDYAEDVIQDAELVQWSGLHDNNGKEIYDGDLFISEWADYDIVKFGKYQYFDGDYESTHHGWHLEHRVGGHATPLSAPLIDARSHEIAGNIYDAPIN